MKQMDILAIGAHPDDIEFGCGGALVKYAERGHRLSLLVMTEGGLGGDVGLRTKEQNTSNTVLGVKKMSW